MGGPTGCGGAVSESVSGNRLPNPIPPRVRRHASFAQFPAGSPQGFPGACTRGRPLRNGCCAVQAVRTGFTRAYASRAQVRSAGPTWGTGPPGPASSPCEPSNGARAPGSDDPPPRAGHRASPGFPGASGSWGAEVPSRAPETGQGRAGADGTPEDAHRSPDRFPYTRPFLFGQLRRMAHPCRVPPPNPRSTCTERVSRALRTLRGLATATRRTSLRRPGVQRFVIECFTPSCHVDNVPSAEPATPARRDAVDSILIVYGGGQVQDRGETCWSDRPDKLGAPRPPRGA
ncbi:hypothetical protein SUDANB145_04689 [Streptomyces sp. enrichment culture]